MHYLKIYFKLCRAAKFRSSIPEFSEKHHIFPISVFGKNNKIVHLSYREHFIAHKLLYLYCKREFGSNHKYTFKMAHAYFMMINCKGDTHRDLYVSSKYYDTARKAVSEARKGVARPDLIGKKYFGASPENIQIARKKISEKKIGVKVDYPKSRKSSSRSGDAAKNISAGRLNTKYKYINMSEDEFSVWLSKQKPKRKDGRINPNITFALKIRKEYYESINSD